MPDKYYKQHFIDEKLCPVEFCTTVFHKNLLQISSVSNPEPEIIYLQNHIPNWHKNLEIIYCLDGNGIMICAGKSFKITSGDIFIINSENTHMITTDTTIKYHCLVIDFDFLLNLCIDVSQIEFCALIKDKKLIELFMDIANILISSNYSGLKFKLEIRIKLLNLFYYLLDSYVYTFDKSTVNTTATAYCKKAIKYIYNNYSDRLTVDRIAEHCTINKAYLSRIFKKQTDKTIVDFINIVRCNQAKRMISQGFSVKEAATACGFNNFSYFSKTYKTHIGNLPSKQEKDE